MRGGPRVINNGLKKLVFWTQREGLKNERPRHDMEVVRSFHGSCLKPVAAEQAKRHTSCQSPYGDAA